MLKKLLFFGLSASCLTFTSCSKKELDSVDTPQPSTLDSTTPRICTDLYLEPKSDSTKRTTAFGERATFWRMGENIRVKFLNGDLTLQNRVKTVANQWMQHANVRFTYVNTWEDSDIRVAFRWNGDGGSWSYVGTGCRDSRISSSNPTMNFGWFDANTTDEEIRRTTLHEFGHAMGLGHEHQNPVGNIQWNRPAVYDFYRINAGWPPAQVDQQVLNRSNTNTTNFTNFDQESIMLYAIPASLTTNGFSTPNNTVLSTTDRAFVGQTYPFSSTKDVLYEGEQLNVNESLISSNGRYRLTLQGDGNLVIYNANNRGIWNSGTWGTSIARAAMQSDGNFVLYDTNGTARFSSNTWNQVGSSLVMQSDGNLVIYQRGQARWTSNTWNQRTTAKK